MKTHFLLILAFSCICCSCKTAPQAEWVSTTFESPWVTQPEVVAVSETSEPDVVVDVTKTAQTIDGLGLVSMRWDGLLSLC